MLSASALTACSDDKFSGDPSKDWEGTTTFFASTDAPDFGTYYMPYDGRVGDPMPYYDQKDGLFKVLYLQEYIMVLAVPMRKMVHIISIIQVITATARTVRW